MTAPTAPSNLAAALIAGPQIKLTWRDNATTENDFIIERSINGGAWTQIGTVPAVTGTGGTGTFTDTGVTTSPAIANYTYRVAARNSVGTSGFSNLAKVPVPAQPLPPSSFNAVNGPNSNKTRSVILTWLDNSSNETGFTIERATNSTFTVGLTSVTVPAGTTTYTVPPQAASREARRAGRRAATSQRGLRVSAVGKSSSYTGETTARCFCSWPRDAVATDDQ